MASDDLVRWYLGGNLPHLHVQEVSQAVTFRLADALPRHVQETLSVPELLDRGYGECLLQHAEIARLVRTTLLAGDGDRYALHAWVVMPNHVHVVFTPSAGESLPEIVRQWKGASAREANRVLQRSGRFWQREYFDRAIRSERHLVRAIEYVENNPVKAGLCRVASAWPWSSAFRGRDRG